MPVACNLGWGGNTTCLEVQSAHGDRLLIDAGSGLSSLNGHESASRFHFLMTHFHIDHIQGLPFFAPLLDRACQLTFWSSTPSDQVGRILDVLMSSPYSPDLAGSCMVLSRAGLWSVQHPRFTRCLGAIGLHVDYNQHLLRRAERMAECIGSACLLPREHLARPPAQTTVRSRARGLAFARPAPHERRCGDETHL